MQTVDYVVAGQHKPPSACFLCTPNNSTTTSNICVYWVWGMIPFNSKKQCNCQQELDSSISGGGNAIIHREINSQHYRLQAVTSSDWDAKKVRMEQSKVHLELNPRPPAYQQTLLLLSREDPGQRSRRQAVQAARVEHHWFPLHLPPGWDKLN